MPDPRHVLGLRAEAAAASWLQDQGWSVLARRHRTRWGELDLVCRDPAGALVAVEVKLRSSDRTGPAAASVDRLRMSRLRRALAVFAAARAARATELRIDLVTLTWSARGWRLQHHRAIDAW